MTLHKFEDYEVDRRERDKARDAWHGLLVFVALITIASLFGCKTGVAPELREASAIAAGLAPAADTLGVTEGHLKTCAISLGCPGQGPCVCTCAAQREPQRKQPKMDYTPPVGLWGPGAYRL